jgi:hypothetical protein
MQSFENFDQSALVDALAEYTARYSRMLSEGGNSEDIDHCRDIINSLMSEINSRKSAGARDATADSGI